MSLSERHAKVILLTAQEEDYKAIKALVESVNLPVDDLRKHLTNFLLLKRENNLIGSVGVEIYDDKALLRSLAVAREYRGNGFGSQLYQAILKKAEAEEISEIYLLTETAEHFFAKRGFQKISRETVDAKVQKSIEFRSACCASAACMRLKLT